MLLLFILRMTQSTLNFLFDFSFECNYIVLYFFSSKKNLIVSFTFQECISCLSALLTYFFFNTIKYLTHIIWIGAFIPNQIYQVFNDLSTQSKLCVVKIKKKQRKRNAAKIRVKKSDLVCKQQSIFFVVSVIQQRKKKTNKTTSDQKSTDDGRSKWNAHQGKYCIMFRRMLYNSFSFNKGRHFYVFFSVFYLKNFNNLKKSENSGQFIWTLCFFSVGIFRFFFSFKTSISLKFCVCQS